jgi:hypothetical protein
MPPRRKKSRAERQRQSAATAPAAEDRAVEALTVGWMIAVLTTIVCQVGAWISMWLVGSNPAATGLALLAWLLSFSAIIVGLLTVMLTILAVRSRREPPPKVITVGAVLAGLLPLAAIFLW